MVFSIIIPVYNVEKYIEKCLDSVANQEFDSFEVIVVDDGSTDGSGRICDAYGERYSNITVIHQENAGVSGARNTGLKNAKGDWILFVDSDDWVEVGMLRTLYAYMQQEKADLYCYNAIKTDENGYHLERLLFSVENKIVGLYNERARLDYFYEILMQYKVGWEACFRVFRRSIIEENAIDFQKYADVFAEDYLFTFQYLLHAERVMQLCNIFYNYRQCGSSLMHSYDESIVILGLHRWAEYIYQVIKKEKYKYLKKNFYKLYFMLLNYHLQTMLVKVDMADIKQQLESLDAYKMHRLWMKQMRKHRKELAKDMRLKKWI